MILPIVKLLKNNENFNINILALTTAKAVLDAEGIPSVGFYDLVKGDFSKLKEIGQKLVGKKSASNVVKYEESVAYHAVNYKELVDVLGESKAAKVFSESGRQAFLPVEFMKKTIREINPDLVVTTNSPRTERAAILAARQLGIPALCLVDLFALQEVKWIGDPDYADHLCVLNESVRSMFIAHGRKESEITVTGNPAFDSLFSDKVLSKVAEAEEKFLPRENSKIRLFYASQLEPAVHPFDESLKGDTELPRSIENKLREFVRENDSFELVVRYHPSENVGFQPQERVYYSKPSESLHALLHAVDLVIVTASTVGLEAHLVGKQVISVDASIFTRDAPFSEMGISEGVTEVDMLGEKIKAIALSNSTTNPEKLDSTTNVIDVIKRLVDK